jgi:hypothetical protein
MDTRIPVARDGGMSRIPSPSFDPRAHRLSAHTYISVRPYRPRPCYSGSLLYSTPALNIESSRPPHCPPHPPSVFDLSTSKL